MWERRPAKLPSDAQRIGDAGDGAGSAGSQAAETGALLDAQAAFTIRLLTLGVLATIVALMWFAAEALWQYRVEDKSLASELQVERSRGDFLYLREALSMSARMAVLTGEPQWHERYDRIALDLDAALASGATVAPSRTKRGRVDATRSANVSLVQREREALAHARNGQAERAGQVLAGGDYRHWQKVYAEAVGFGPTDRRSARLERLRGQVIYFDEALTMSAQLAVAAGDLAWKDRHHAFRAQLDAALAEVRKLAPSVTALDAVALTEDANGHLLAAEERAFELVAQGARESASEQLSSAEYRHLKHRYAAGMETLGPELREQASGSLALEQRMAWLKTLPAMTVVPLLALGWVFVARGVRSNQRKLRRLTDELTAKARELRADVSARKRVESALRESLRDLEETQRQVVQSGKLAGLGRLAAGVAHEVNSPLTGILGVSSLLVAKLQGGEVPEDLKEQLQTLARGAERCRDIVSKLLAFARQSSGIRQSVPVADIVEDTLRLFRAELVRAQIDVSTEVEPKLRVWANPTEFQQIATNIILNASDAMSRGGRLSIRGMPADGGGVVLEFSDTGTGIAKEHLDQIFEPFFTTKAVGRGTGLGLSVVHGLVQRHGGSIEVSSSPCGTTFRLAFPAGEHGTDQSRIAPAANSEVAASHGTPGSWRVLIVDDDELVRNVVKTLVEQGAGEGWAFHVRVADSADAALRALRAESCDLLITDLAMKGMDGAALAQQVRHLDPAPRVMLMTGYGSAHLADYPGVDEILVKPFVATAVHQAIRRLLGRAKPTKHRGQDSAGSPSGSSKEAVA